MTNANLFVVENAVKNTIVLVVLCVAFPYVQGTLQDVPQKFQANVLIAVGLLLGGSVAGNFAFTYDKTNIESHADRYFGHVTTLLLTFSIGLMLEITVCAMAITPGSFNTCIRFAAAAVFASIIVFDFWDVYGLVHRSRRAAGGG